MARKPYNGDNPMTIVTEYDWESDTFTHHADNAARHAWRETVAEIAVKAKGTLPDCAGRVDRLSRYIGEISYDSLVSPL